MEWCCSLDRTRSEGGRMKRPDLSCVEGVASSSTSVPRGRKDRGQGRSSRDRTRAIHIRCLWAGALSASHEREAPDSFPFAKMRFSCLHPVIPRSTNLNHPYSNHISRPIPGSPRSLPVADKTSFPFPFWNFSKESLSIRSLCKFKFISSSASLHPIPIFSFLTARSPRQILLRSLFPANCPDSRANNAFFGTLLLHSALSPCHVSPSHPPLALPPTLCCYLAAAAVSNLLHHRPPAHVTMSFRSTTHTHPFPLF